MNKLILIVWLAIQASLLSAQPLPQWSHSISTNFQNYYYGLSKLKLDHNGDLVVVTNSKNQNGGTDILTVKYSQDGLLLWTQLYASDSGKYHEARDFIIDQHNNIIITGLTLIDSANTNILTLKYGFQGSLEWENTIGHIAGRKDEPNSINLDSKDNIYLTGFSAIDNTNSHSLANISKIDTNGNTRWTYYYGWDTIVNYNGIFLRVIDDEVRVFGRFWALNPHYFTLALDTSGNYLNSNEEILTGWISSAYIDDLGNSYAGAASVGYKITKINPNGNIAWSQTVPTNLPSNVFGDEVTALTVDSLHNVYITGRHYGDDYAGPTYSNADILTNKYNMDGNLVWSRRFEYLGNNAADIAFDIFVDKALNVHVAGESEPVLAGMSYDFLVLKYDKDGNDHGCIRYHEGNGDDRISSIVVIDSNRIFVTGITEDNNLTFNTTQRYSTMSSVGVNESKKDNDELKVFPNPTTGEIKVLGAKDAVLEIYTVAGQLIFQDKLVDNQIISNISYLSPGIYVLCMKTEETVIIKRIVKQ